MTEKVAVVKPYYLKEEAYRMGYNEFEGLDLQDPEEMDLDGFRQSARYANHVLPELRSMAGFEDGGHGTYTQNRRVAAIDAGCEEDEPAEATLTDAEAIFSELLEAWEMGARDGGTGDSFDPDAALA